MFYNDNNWNLMAQIIFELQNIENIDQKILSFKSFIEDKRAEILKDVSFRLGACGFPANTEMDVYTKLVFRVSKEELSEYLMEALHYIDMRLSHNDNMRIFMLDGEISVSPMRQLNKNAKELGIMILPKLKCAWSRKTKKDGTFTEMSVSKGINELMQNYYYIDKKELGRYEVQNYVIKNIEGMQSRKTLRIAVSPLTNEDVLSIREYVKDGKKKIGITDVANSRIKQKVENPYHISEKQLSDKVRKIIEESANIKADILMFPEMLGTRTIRENSLAYLARLDMEQNKHIPLFTLLPTEWKCGNMNCDNRIMPEESTNNTNTLYVACRGDLIDGDSFKVSFRQQKQNPYFEREGELAGKIEDIESDHQICILHIPDLGRITFPICADLISEDYRKILIEKLGATLILCPSFSKGFDDFIQLTDIGTCSGCRIVWCNSCAVRHLYSKKAQGIFKESDICCTGVSCSRNYFPVKPEVKCINGQCGDSCLFYIDIPLSFLKSETEESELSWKHLISWYVEV